MKNSKFEYFLNAIHYCIYRGEVRSTKKIEKAIKPLLSFVEKLFFTKRFRNKIYRRQLQNSAELEEYMYGKKYGQSIGSAHHWFGLFYSGYPTILSFVLLGYADKMFGSLSMIPALTLIAIPIALCYIPAYNAVFTKDRYLAYFKKFEKKDQQWHRKWKWITIGFCVGSVIAIAFGVIAMYTVEHNSLPSFIQNLF